MSARPPIYLATVGIEPARWRKPRGRLIDVAAYGARARSAGFAGLEIWEHHVVDEAGEVDLALVARLAAAGVRCPIFGSYVQTFPTDYNRRRREAVNRAVRALGASSLKFNLSSAEHPVHGAAPDAPPATATEWTEAIEFLRQWMAELPDTFFLCECHRGGLVVEPAEVHRLFEAVPAARLAVISHAVADAAGLERELAVKGGRLRHLHVSTPRRDRDGFRRGAQRLRASGLPLSWSLEFPEPAYGGGDSEACFAAAVEDLDFIRSCLTNAV